MTDNQYFEEAKRVKKIRLKLGMEASEMAKLMGITVNSYYQIELGRSGFSMSFLRVIAKLGGSINYLLTGEPPMFIKEVIFDESKQDEENTSELYNTQIDEKEEIKPKLSLEEALANLQYQIDQMNLRLP
jgi:transcriptional regulator with XRE-family HTH domain